MGIDTFDRFIDFKYYGTEEIMHEKIKLITKNNN